MDGNSDEREEKRDMLSWGFAVKRGQAVKCDDRHQWQGSSIDYGITSTDCGRKRRDFINELFAVH